MKNQRSLNGLNGLEISDNLTNQLHLSSFANLVPRVLSFPPYGASVGWVGENPGNEVAHLRVRQTKLAIYAGQLIYT